jgi:hypothetical protein
MEQPVGDGVTTMGPKACFDESKQGGIKFPALEDGAREFALL